MKKISKSFGEIIIDEEDLPFFNSCYWSPIIQGKSGKLWRLYSQKYKNYYHRIIMNAKKGEYVDHINHNPLDNRKENLRLVDNKTNCQNTQSHRDSISKYKGVSYWGHPSHRKKRWLAQMYFNYGETKLKRYFASEIEAAICYNNWVEKFIPKPHVLNEVNMFEVDLKFGNEGEEFFYVLHRPLLLKTDGLKSDLLIAKTNEGIQLKTDRRASVDTGNLFIERYSHKINKTNGGPWKASEDGSKYFVYFFWKDKKILAYDNALLIDFLETSKYELFNVKVGRSNASGFLVPISALEHLLLNFNKIIGRENE